MVSRHDGRRVETVGYSDWEIYDVTPHAGLRAASRARTQAAEELYYRALAIARAQQAQLWERRAAVSLAQLRRDQARRGEARDLLAPVDSWFTEGFDTLDLKEAKALLDELQA